MHTRFTRTLTVAFVAPFVALACGGTSIEQSGSEPFDEDRVSSDSGGTGGNGSMADPASAAGAGGDTVPDLSATPGGDVRNPTPGEAGEPVQLPAFVCNDPMFFPLRVDEQGNPIEYEPDELEEDELGSGGAAGEVGTGDLTVLLVFDKSGSMASPWGGKSRWQAGSDALLLALDGILDTLTLGGLFFPFDEEGRAPGCGVPPITLRPQIDFTTGRGFKESWIARACEAQPEGSTPLEHALEVADQAIVSAQERGLMKERMRVLLVTDGEPTCEDDLEAIVSFPTRWFAMGIETVVIGLPGSAGAHDLLDAIAAAGGTEKHSSPAQIGEFEEQVYVAVR